jgi:hypothetical protein
LRKNDWARGRNGSEVEALKAFTVWLRDPRLDLSRLRSAPKPSKMMKVGAVDISVRPDALVVDKAGDAVGCLKLYLGKGPLDKERAAYAAAILHQYAEDTLGAGKRADSGSCFVLDVFNRKIYAAPKSFKKRRADVVDACVDIALLWPTV